MNSDGEPGTTQPDTTRSKTKLMLPQTQHLDPSAKPYECIFGFIQPSRSYPIFLILVIFWSLEFCLPFWVVVFWEFKFFYELLLPLIREIFHFIVIFLFFLYQFCLRGLNSGELGLYWHSWFQRHLTSQRAVT